MTNASKHSLDEEYIALCLKLALQAQGRTAPNPVVGAVVLDASGAVVGEGFHARAGQAHAEVEALNAAGERAKDGTLYVNLEPCCHHGRTGPCAQRVIESGVRRVVVGMLDPNPKVAGGGVAAIRANGIAVDVGVLEPACRWENRAFLSRIVRSRPWVCLKLATTLDGQIADRYRQSKWISGPAARMHVHQLRNTLDCILVGSETVRRDDPELTVRDVEGGRNPHRAILDARLTLPPDKKLLAESESGARTFVFCSKRPELRPRLEACPAHLSVIRVNEKSDIHGFLDLSEILRALAAQEINSLLCEGGGRLAASLLADSLVDEVHWIVSPKILNDTSAVPALGLDNDVHLSAALKLTRNTTSFLGEDVLVQGVLGEPSFLSC